MPVHNFEMDSVPLNPSKAKSSGREVKGSVLFVFGDNLEPRLETAITPVTSSAGDRGGAWRTYRMPTGVPRRLDRLL